MSGLGRSAVGGGAAVQNIANNFSSSRQQAEVEASDLSKWAAHDFLRLHSARPRQRLCMAAAVSDEVRAKGSTSGAIGFTGLQSCGSITCPTCGPRIGGLRRSEITRALDAWTRGAGGTIYFGTLTLRHDRSQSFALLADALLDCWHKAIGGSSWLSDRRAHGIAHTIRVIETKFSFQNGWHVHVHFLLLVEPGSINPEILLASMHKRWTMQALRLGLGVPLLAQGADLHEVTGEEAADVMGKYFAKEAGVSGSRPAESLGWEMTGNESKSRGESLSPGELLALAVGGDKAALALYNEFELGMKNRRTIAWSKGARGELGVGDELTPDEIAAAADAALVIEYFGMPARVFRKISRIKGMRGELVSVIREFGGLTAVLWLRARGFEIYDDELEVARL